MTDAMPNLRTALAHGGICLHPNGDATVLICAGPINQL